MLPFGHLEEELGRRSEEEGSTKVSPADQATRRKLRQFVDQVHLIERQIAARFDGNHDRVEECETLIVFGGSLAVPKEAYRVQLRTSSAAAVPGVSHKGPVSVSNSLPNGMHTSGSENVPPLGIADPHALRVQKHRLCSAVIRALVTANLDVFGTPLSATKCFVMFPAARSWLQDCQAAAAVTTTATSVVNPMSGVVPKQSFNGLLSFAKKKMFRMELVAGTPDRHGANGATETYFKGQSIYYQTGPLNAIKSLPP